jgi:hypothetical protein
MVAKRGTMSLMRRTIAVLLFAGSTACKPLEPEYAHVAAGRPGVDPAPAARDWARRCANRIQEAGKRASRVLPELAHLTTKVDASPWQPTVEFEAPTGSGGYYKGSVVHGLGECNDFSTDGIFPWTDRNPAPPYVVDRLRRFGDDDARLEAKGVPADTAAVFCRTFEPALDVCLREALEVPFGKWPPTTRSCMDEGDKCPKSGETHSDDDGCPE